MHWIVVPLLLAAMCSTALSQSYYRLPSYLRSAFQTQEELLNNTVLMAGGLSQLRQGTVWITQPGFLDYHRDVERTVREFMRTNDIHNAGSTEFNSGRFQEGCCPQLAFYSAVESLTNINGEKKYLVHFDSEVPARYQHIPFALCTGKETYCTYGHCFQGTTVMNLLAYDHGQRPPISFDHFQIPTYCGCVQY